MSNCVRYIAVCHITTAYVANLRRLGFRLHEVGVLRPKPEFINVP